MEKIENGLATNVSIRAYLNKLYCRSDEELVMFIAKKRNGKAKNTHKQALNPILEQPKQEELQDLGLSALFG